MLNPKISVSPGANPGSESPKVHQKKAREKRAFFNEINPFYGFVKCASRVKYAFGV